MEIDITDFFKAAAPMDYSASVAELGPTAGRDTWQAACEDAPDWPLLAAPGAVDAFKDHVRDFGAWDDAEIGAWDENECTALFLQLIAGDMREAGLDGDSDEQAWLEYAADENASQRIARGVDGRVYYYLGT